jgi:hypothetical protein
MIRYLILITLFAAGIWSIILSFSPLENQKRSESWQSTRAIITSSGVEQFERKEKKPGGTDTKTKITYKPKLSYSYSIENKEYTGNRLDFSNQSYQDPQIAKDIQQSYAIGKETEIFYNPLDPKESVITRDGQAIIPLTSLGVLLSCWSAWCIIGPIIRKRPDQ